MSNEVYLVDYIRTAFSRSRPKEPEKDVFNSLRMDEALAKLINHVIEKNSINPNEIDDVITGCAMQAGENYLYGGRHPVLLANLPISVPGVAVERACSSSMMAISIGAMEIMSGNSEIVLAGGIEHMTHVPMSDNPCIMPNFKLLLRPEYMKYQMNIAYSMGLTAEKLAEESGITKDEMDEYALRSHKLAYQSLQEGWFKGEILPIQVEYKGELIIVDKDQSIRGDANLEQIKKLPPAFKEGGVITAGNSSPLNAGASLVLLMSEKKVNEYGLKPLAKIKGFSWVGVEPQVMGKGPVPATKKLLRKFKLEAGDIDYWEINEAFAVVVLFAINELGLDLSKVNIHGGAIAIGHPLGATGARIVGTLARILKEKGKNLGIATLCVGGGQGFSMLIERT
ncbi:MAG: acetyl-CoA C-acetyltransferase [Thermoproteota archaeon]|jgi:acetyl-CoA acetyltransferases